MLVLPVLVLISVACLSEVNNTLKSNSTLRFFVQYLQYSTVEVAFS